MLSPDAAATAAVMAATAAGGCRARSLSEAVAVDDVVLLGSVDVDGGVSDIAADGPFVADAAGGVTDVAAATLAPPAPPPMEP